MARLLAEADAAIRSTRAPAMPCSANSRVAASRMRALVAAASYPMGAAYTFEPDGSFGPAEGVWSSGVERTNWFVHSLPRGVKRGPAQNRRRPGRLPPGGALPDAGRRARTGL